MIYYNIALRAKIIKINRINKIFSNHFNPFNHSAQHAVLLL